MGIVHKKKDSWWFGEDYNMNIYRGCSHRCIYCDSRSECYGIEEFDNVTSKENAVKIIREELRKKRKCGVIGTGAMSDPYNPKEKTLCLTREALKIIYEYEFGVSIATKGTIIRRDIDILKKINEIMPVLIKVTITGTMDNLGKIIEPNAPSYSERFEVLEEMSRNGLFCGILLMPVLPYITDSEENIKEIVKRGKEVGVRFIYPEFGVTLRDRQREYFFDRLDENFIGIKEKYAADYGNAYICRSSNCNEIKRIFEEECKKRGILYKMENITEEYKKGKNGSQMRLF